MFVGAGDFGLSAAAERDCDVGEFVESGGLNLMIEITGGVAVGVGTGVRVGVNVP